MRRDLPGQRRGPDVLRRVRSPGGSASELADAPAPPPVQQAARAGIPQPFDAGGLLGTSERSLLAAELGAVEAFAEVLLVLDQADQIARLKGGLIQISALSMPADPDLASHPHT
jgi:hypothetical protein